MDWFPLQARLPQLEAGPEPPRNQGHATLPHPAPGRLPKVSRLSRPFLLLQLNSRAGTGNPYRYNRLVGNLHHLTLRLSRLPPTDPFRLKRESALLSKAYDIGLVDTGAKMSDILDKVNVSAFARRRLGVVMVRLKMSQSVKQAVTYIEQGQIRVGPDTITDPAFLVTRNMEDL